MQLTEIFADEQGETHFRRTRIDFTTRAFVPPSMSVEVSEAVETTTSLFMTAPTGWDKEFHPTPRRQFGVMLGGRLSVLATNSEKIEMGPGDVLLVNDAESKGHLIAILGDEDAAFMFVGLNEGTPAGA